MKIIYHLFITCFVTTNAFAMADKTPPVYGVPTLYGEYEISPDDARRASSMYGKTPNRPSSIQAGVIKNSSVAKHPVKAKKVAPKKKKAKKKPVTKKASIVEKVESVVPTPELTVVSVDKVPVDTVVAPSQPVPSQHAVDIAAHVADKIDTESFCTQVKYQGKGNLPDGIIMMTGRPDLMSCTSNSKN